MPAPLTPLLGLLYGLSAAATGLGWAIVARRDRQHLPAALLLSTGLGTDLARRALSALVLAPAHAALGTAPFPPAFRWAVALEVGLQLAYPAAVAASAIALYARARRAWWPALAAWALLAGALVALYPAVRGEDLALVYRVAHGLAAGVAALAFLAWARRREPMSPARWVVLFTTATEMVCVIGPWARPFTSWSLAHVAYSMLYAVLITLQGGRLWTPPSSSPSAS